jgi:vancomycin permeability regulator SanA
MAFQGLEAEDVRLRYRLLSRLREFGARLRALADVALGAEPWYGGARIALGVDPPP